ncbi:stage III sporulation protein AG [Ruminococcus sp. Marseille-P6503]|uniref:stage III sporulation protein AG n=1 Tax=Ruminococcus sp. Marseille-P6503 TaxID=2364796 RepID=UPI000F53F190|nr:stage III sporulation protein AG [Ruminococcus sp. Marseille-P6503]
MKLSEIKKRFFSFSKLDRRTKIILAAGLIGIALIFISEIVPGSPAAESEAEEISDDIVTEDSYQYKRQIESELIEMLSQIKGVGSVSAMVTIEGTTEYVYAEELDTATDKDGEQLSERYQNQIVMTEKDGEKKALVKQIIKPKIGGVVIVCDGGSNTSVNERVIKAVSTALNLPASKICVECRK